MPHGDLSRARLNDPRWVEHVPRHGISLAVTGALPPKVTTRVISPPNRTLRSFPQGQSAQTFAKRPPLSVIDCSPIASKLGQNRSPLDASGGFLVTPASAGELPRQRGDSRRRLDQETLGVMQKLEAHDHLCGLASAELDRCREVTDEVTAPTRTPRVPLRRGSRPSPRTSAPGERRRRASSSSRMPSFTRSRAMTSSTFERTFTLRGRMVATAYPRLRGSTSRGTSTEDHALPSAKRRVDVHAPPRRRV